MPVSLLNRRTRLYKVSCETTPQGKKFDAVEARSPKEAAVKFANEYLDMGSPHLAGKAAGGRAYVFEREHGPRHEVWVDWV